MNLHQKILATNINSFLSENKLINFGVYNGLPITTNTNEWDQKKGWKNPRRWQRKAWIFLGAYSEDICVGFAIVDAGYIGKAFCYVYFPKTGELIEDGIDRPLAFSNKFEAGFNADWKLGNYSIKTQASGRMLFEYTGKKFSVALACQNNENGLSFMCPSKGENRPFHFTYKNLLVPTDILFEQKGKKQKFDNLWGGIDYSKGYPPKHTTWNWTSFLGKTTDGIPVGINLVDQFNENMENVVWFGTERQLIGKVDFEYSKPLEKSAWKVKSIANDLELILQPNGSRKENINLKVLKSKFIQVFGKIEGKIKINEQWHSISGYGVMEEHEAIW